MEHVKNLITLLSERLKRVAAGNAVVAKAVSVGDRHIVPLCELGLTFGGGGGTGEGKDKRGQSAAGLGAAAGGGADDDADGFTLIKIVLGRVRAAQRHGDGYTDGSYERFSHTLSH